MSSHSPPTVVLVHVEHAALMAATQRPITREALAEPSGDDPCLWRDVPTSLASGTDDRNIPAAAQRFTAERARSRRTLELSGGSHAVAVARPGPVADLILEAAAGPAAA